MPFLNAKVEPSRICLGTAVYGSAVSREQSFALLDAFTECGGTFIDTAHVYADWLPHGRGASERTVGEWIRANGMRDRIVLATKGGHPPLNHMELGACSREGLVSNLEESLDRLGLQSVDLYWLHRDDPGRGVDEIVDTLADFVQQGRIGAFGGSNWTWPRLMDANAYARATGVPGMVASQPGWALVDRAPGPVPVVNMYYLDEETRQEHAATEFPLVAYTAQARGYFGETNVRWAKGGYHGIAPLAPEYDTETSRGRLFRAMELAELKGVTANQIALAYILNQPFSAYAIIGTSKVETVREACAAERIALTEQDCGYLREGK